MNTFLLTLVSAAVLIAAVIATGHHLDAGSLLAILVAAYLPAWTLRDYREKPAPLRASRRFSTPKPRYEPQRPSRPFRPVVLPPAPLPSGPRAPISPGVFGRVSQTHDRLVSLPSE